MTIQERPGVGLRSFNVSIEVFACRWKPHHRALSGNFCGFIRSRRCWSMTVDFRLEIAETRPVKRFVQIDFGNGDGSPFGGLSEDLTVVIKNRGLHPLQGDITV